MIQCTSIKILNGAMEMNVDIVNIGVSQTLLQQSLESLSHLWWESVISLRNYLFFTQRLLPGLSMRHSI